MDKLPHLHSLNPFSKHAEAESDKPPKSTSTSTQPSGPKSSLKDVPDDNNQSLHTILPTPEQRAALTLLLASICVQMRGNITAIFDPRFVGELTAGPLGANPLDNPDLDVGKADVEAAEEAQKKRERIVEELSKEEVQKLKKDVLEFYDGWRKKALDRIGDVLGEKDHVKEQVAEVTKKMGDAAAQDSKKDEDVKLEKWDEDEGKSEQAELLFKELYPPVKTELVTELSEDQRKVVLHSVMLLLLSLEHYAAYSRILLLNLASSLNLKLAVLSEDESSIARTLLTAAELSADAETKKAAEDNASSRKWKVGLATAAGAALIGVTGGLAAPIVAAGVGSVMGGLGIAEFAAAGYLGSLASSSLVVGSLFGAYGAKMSGKMMDEYAKEVEDFGFVQIHKHHRPRKIEMEYRRLRVAIGISGWLTDKEEVVKPWRVLSSSIEGFALRWELEKLLELGNAITGMLRTTAWVYAKKQLLKRSVLGVMMAELWPLKIIKMAHVVDNPFSVGLVRADKAGEVLADALANRVQGERPVTLIGYSLGARVIQTCLRKLAERKQFGLVENAVVLGSPMSSQSWDWRQMRAAVSGRLVNVYSENDYILAFLYRANAMELGVAGLEKVEGVKGVENIDVSDIVSGHLQYRFLTGSILKKIGFEDLDNELVEAEEEDMKEMQEKEEKETKEQEDKDTKEGKGDDEQIKDLEKKVEKRNHEKVMDWATTKLQGGKDALGGWWGSKAEEEEEGKADATADAKTEAKTEPKVEAKTDDQAEKK
ncbi:DUF726-domain-containing protein [Microthyrium microscopicum]|uniref:DUF726-domain-containing protein n=1 Tax=Microthyrium microscopicum TaxID=703497 RepID=A0A6A6UB51_9PEZI|nr:DUF726-domain-containing protein [Microthyrium microscopicum]